MPEHCEDLERETVLVADGDARVRQRLVQGLARQGRTVRAFATAGEVLGQALVHGAACLVTEVSLPDGSGSQLAARLGALRLGAAYRSIPVIFVSDKADVAQSVRAMKAGASDFLLKPLAQKAVLRAVETALHIDRGAMWRLKEQARILGRYDRLTPREREVLKGITQGLMNKQIAWKLQIAEITVKLHRAHLTQKLDLRSVPDLLRASQIIAANRPLGETA